MQSDTDFSQETDGSKPNSIINAGSRDLHPNTPPPWKAFLNKALLWMTKGRRGRLALIFVPYFWLFLFFLAPFLIVLKISFADPILASPPFTDLFNWEAEGLFNKIQITFYNYQLLFSESLYIVAYLNSIKIALFSTIFCLLLGYPIAYGIARADAGLKNLLLLLVVLPFWTSFLLRVYAWIGILKQNGYINNLLMSLGIIDTPIQMINNDFAIYVGITYSYLPFMILPLYATLEKMDPSLLEAALDLGCRPWKAFVKVTLPLSWPGILAGSMLVFIPAVGEFVIPSLLGGPNSLMIGRVLWDEFFSNKDWPVASSLAILILLVLVLPIVLFQKVQMPREEKETAT